MENNNKIQGFTLVELAMVMVIFGLLVSGFGYGLIAYQKQQKYDVTRFRLAAIQKGMDEFLELNGRLPCVARLDRRPDQAGFGFEVTSASWGCGGPIPGAGRYDPDAGALAGTLGGAHNTLFVRFGSVPVRSLNLPDEYMVDGWGGRFTYLVSIRQAAEDSGVSRYAENAGAINVVDTNGNSVIDQANPRFPGFRNFAEYVVISHGEDQKGARSLGNGLSETIPCPTIAAETQAENCRHTAGNPNVVISNVMADGDYDDIVVYKAGTSLNDILPSGAVVAFDQVFNESGGAGIRAFDAGAPGAGVGPGSVSTPAFRCPVGYRDFTQGRGRFLMGSTAPGTTFDRPIRHGRLNTTPTTRNYRNLGSSGEDAARSIPPYLTTLFCEKQS